MTLQQDGYLLSRRFKPSLQSQIHTPSTPCHSASLSIKQTFLSAEHIKPSLHISLNLPRYFHPFIFFPISSKHDLLSYPSSFLSPSIPLFSPPELKLLSLLSVISSASVICVRPTTWLHSWFILKRNETFAACNLKHLSTFNSILNWHAGWLFKNKTWNSEIHDRTVKISKWFQYCWNNHISSRKLHSDFVIKVLTSDIKKLEQPWKWACGQKWLQSYSSCQSQIFVFVA